MTGGRSGRPLAVAALALAAISASCVETEIDLSPPHVGTDCECRIRCPSGRECDAFDTTCGPDGLCVGSPEGGSCLNGFQLACAQLAATAACIPLRAGAVCPSLEVDAGADASAAVSYPADDRVDP